MLFANLIRISHIAKIFSYFCIINYSAGFLYGTILLGWATKAATSKI